MVFLQQVFVVFELGRGRSATESTLVPRDSGALTDGVRQDRRNVSLAPQVFTRTRHFSPLSKE
ncbi:MAG: hypothetical protein CMJ48_00865 [Planctomycetaceae bacterium]|nr:hypothetical protein [Planctomycetaceae bacterium]